MKLKLIASLILIILSSVTFGQKKTKQIIFPPPVFGLSDPEFISACELPMHKNELVYTRFIYRGTDEYWGLHSADKKCKDINAYLEIPDSVELKSEYPILFKDVHDHYWNTYLIIDAIGTFDDSRHRYGHLGSNNSQFIVKWIANIQKVQTKK